MVRSPLSLSNPPRARQSKCGEIDRWETQLAAEGSALSEDARVAFAQQFALAPDAAAKRVLAERCLVPGSPDFVYYEALCVLLDAQALVERETRASDEAALSLLEKNAVRLDTAESFLESKNCTRKRSRVQQRRMLLELELQRRLDGSSERLKVGIAGSSRRAVYLSVLT